MLENICMYVETNTESLIYNSIQMNSAIRV